jgi:hypothetical protein
VIGMDESKEWMYINERNELFQENKMLKNEIERLKKYTMDDLLDDLVILEGTVREERSKSMYIRDELFAHHTGRLWMLDFVKRWIEGKVNK